MSKEFEEIVLKKLEKLDSLETQVASLGEHVRSLDAQAGSLKLEMQETNKRLGKLEVEVQSTKQGLQSTKQALQTLTTKVDERFGQVENRLGKLEIEVKDTCEVVNYLNQNFTKFDYEINKKIDTLFDAFTVNREKNLVHEKEIDSLNAKVFNQDIRISNLEDKVLTA